jgi:tetratricopeptide (TPR) repeat protein
VPFRRTGDGLPRSLSRAVLAFLPGPVEVRVVGESFHLEAIERVATYSSPGSPLTAVLVPEQDNPYDRHAVAVYVADEHVGFLPRETAPQVQPALVAFSRTYRGQLVSCPAEIRLWDEGAPDVIAWLDPFPLGLRPEAFDAVPRQDDVLSELLRRLDQPQPHLTGTDLQARSDMVAAEKQRAEIDASYDRDPQAWPTIEAIFRGLADRFGQAGDAFIAAAWLNVGRSVRYQRGRRDDALAAYVEALFWDRRNAEAWSELVDMASLAPDVPTLVELFARVPFGTRRGVLRELLIVSHGHDRLGRMSPEAGELLRQELLLAAEAQGDNATVAILTGRAGLDADQAGDIGMAVELWRRAVSAGSTDAKVAERLSSWLVKHREYSEAAQVLRRALAVRPRAEVAERMERRLARCERQLAQDARLCAAPGQR